MNRKTLLIAGLAAVISAAIPALAQVPGVNSTITPVFNLVYESSTSKATYSATQLLTPASSATDICVLTGSTTKTLRVRRVIFTGITTSTVAVNPVAIIKRSTANTAGTSGAMTAVSYNSTNAAASGTAKYYTANPTVGTAVGLLADPQYTFNLTTSAVPSNVLEVKFGEFGSPVFLRGIAQQLSVNLNGATVAGPVSCTFEWTEDNDS